MAHDHPPVVPTPDPATLPTPDGSNFTGLQLVAIMAATLLAGLIFLDLVSG